MDQLNKHKPFRGSHLSTTDILRKLGDQDEPQKVKSYTHLSESMHGVRMLSKNLANSKMDMAVENVLIVTKARDNSLIYLTRELAEWILVHFPRIKVYVDEQLALSKRFRSEELVRETKSENLKFWNTEFLQSDKCDTFDLVITLGGDGTVLYVSSLFQKSVPPVLSFSLGSLGFLTNFQYEDFRYFLGKILRDGSQAKTNLRMRLMCSVYKNGQLVDERHVLNEVTVDRGASPFISMLELYGDDELLTVSQADGLIVATPTGSTAYSLSAGGSLVHPSVSAISVTPICPHTLSFRPIILPDSMVLTVKVPERSRNSAWASFDGKHRVHLQKGDHIVIQTSPFGFPTVQATKTEFFDSVSRTLNWNMREQQKSFTSMLSTKNRLHYENNTDNDSDVDLEIDEE